MAEGEVDQEIVTRFVVDADEALANAAKFNQTVEEIKAQLMSLATSSGQSLKTVAEGMKQAFAEMRLAQAQEAFGGKAAWETAKPADIKPYLTQVNEDIATYNKAISEAVSRTLEEINGATKQSAKERADAEKSFVEQQKVTIKQEEDARKQQIAGEKANLNAAKAAQQEYVNAWKSGIPVMSAGAKAFGDQVQQSKVQIQQLAATTGQSFSQIGQQMVQGGANINVVKQAIRELNSEASNTPGIMSRVGSAITIALGIGLEQIVMRTIRAIIDGFKQVTQAGFEYAQALVRLQIGTNLLQKAGLNITMKETLDLIDQLNQKFPVFTRKSIIEGVGYMQILSQNLGLSADQMKNLSEVSGALAVVLGKDVGEATKEIALFLSSGYGEALQRAGILASKASVEHELLAMGIKESYNNVDQATRAQAGYNVIMQQAAELTKKAEEAQKGYAFANVKLTNSWQGLIDVMGLRAAPALANVMDFLSKAVDGFKSFYNMFSYYVSLMIGNTIQLAASFQLLFTMLKRIPEYGTDIKKFMHDYLQGLVDIANQSQEAGRKMALPDIFGSFKDDAIGAGEGAKDAAKNIADAVDELYKKITDSQKQFADDSLKIETDYQRDIEKIDRDAQFRREQYFIDFIRKISSINAKLAEDIYKENISYQSGVADALQSYNDQRADAEQKYRNNELKAQKDFEEKMRRLREDFILNMEDALRERDARQVLRLIRQFNVEQDRLKRQAQSDKEERAREYKQELAQIERQKNERLKKLAEEHAIRLAELQRQAQIERQQAWQNYLQQLEDLKRSQDNEKAERDIKFQQQMNDLAAQQKARLQSILDALVAERNLTGTMLEQIMALYRSKYGPGGELEALYTYATSIITALNDALTYAAKAAAGGWGQTPNMPTSPTNQQWSGPPTRTPVPHYATGGSFVAASPTIAQFGEVPELVNITPLNQINKMPPVGQTSKSKSNKVAIDVFLSPDLEARIIDKTLDMNADVMVDIQRRR